MSIPAAGKGDEMGIVKLLDATLKPPFVNTNPGSVYLDRCRNYNMVIGAAGTRRGRIWAAWVSGGDSPDAYFVLSTSDNRGETWSQPRLVIDPPDHVSGLKLSILVGNLWLAPDGAMWLIFDQSLEQFDGRAGVWLMRCANPDADIPAWTAPLRICDGMTLNKPLVHSSGDWLIPVSLWDRSRISPRVRALDSAVHSDLDPWRMSNVFASRDQGVSWQRRGGVLVPRPRFDEAVLIERRDGSIWMTCRTETTIFESSSRDIGATWSTPSQCAIAHISARHFIMRLASGRLLLVKHGLTADTTTAGRTHLTAFLSDDDGITWQGSLLLEPRTERDCSYPDGFQFDDGTIAVVYDYGRADPSEVLMARFNERDVLTSSPAEPGSRLGILVSRAAGPR